MKPKIVVLDTNFLLIPSLYKVDIFAEINRLMDEPYELCIIDKTIEELEKIIKTGKTKERGAVNVALGLIKQKDLKTLNSSKDESVDQSILNQGIDYVATQDKELRIKAKKKGIRIITLRQKKYLRIE